MEKVYIVGGTRTPVGSLLGSLKEFTAIDLGVYSAKATITKFGVNPNTIDEVILGNVISAGLGQNPSRQVAIRCGINSNTPCFNINKVCASGMKSITLAAQSLKLNDSSLVLCGGFESMTNAPHLINNYRKGHKFGNYKIIDSLSNDGLTDPYNECAMGFCGEHTAKEMGITRQMQDDYCKLSYKRAILAQKNGSFKSEIIPLTTKKNKIVDLDEEPLRYKESKISQLKPVFVSK
jgi:acetyl-CoA C-acetyltransferase